LLILSKSEGRQLPRHSINMRFRLCFQDIFKVDFLFSQLQNDKHQTKILHSDAFAHLLQFSREYIDNTFLFRFIGVNQALFAAAPITRV
jgi:hypothetical protein